MVEWHQSTFRDKTFAYLPTLLESLKKRERIGFPLVRFRFGTRSNLYIQHFSRTLLPSLSTWGPHPLKLTPGPLPYLPRCADWRATTVHARWCYQPGKPRTHVQRADRVPMCKIIPFHCRSLLEQVKCRFPDVEMQNKNSKSCNCKLKHYSKYFGHGNSGVFSPGCSCSSIMLNRPASLCTKRCRQLPQEPSHHKPPKSRQRNDETHHQVCWGKPGPN